MDTFGITLFWLIGSIIGFTFSVNYGSQLFLHLVDLGIYDKYPHIHQIGET